MSQFCFQLSHFCFLLFLPILQKEHALLFFLFLLFLPFLLSLCLYLAHGWPLAGYQLTVLALSMVR
jgi:hypothetical protein